MNFSFDLNFSTISEMLPTLACISTQRDKVSTIFDAKYHR